MCSVLVIRHSGLRRVQVSKSAKGSLYGRLTPSVLLGTNSMLKMFMFQSESGIFLR